MIKLDSVEPVGKADKLKPCPFCGGKVKIECIDDEYYYISCERCCSSTSFGKVFEDGTAADATKAESIVAWNRRTDNDL